MNEADRKLLKKRERMAEEAGEGVWFKNGTNEQCITDVTFYPTQKLWITEGGTRREITLKELNVGYHQLKV